MKQPGIYVAIGKEISLAIEVEGYAPTIKIRNSINLKTFKEPTELELQHFITNNDRFLIIQIESIGVGIQKNESMPKFENDIVDFVKDSMRKNLSTSYITTMLVRSKGWTVSQARLVVMFLQKKIKYEGLDL